MSDPSSQSLAPSGAEQPRSASDDPNIRSAVTFLADPRVRKTTIDRKIAFLKGKGLTAEQISNAFQQAGQSVNIEKINAISAAATVSPSSTPLLSVQHPQQQQPPSSPYTTTSRNSSFSMARAAGSHTLYPYTPAPSRMMQPGAGQAESKADWRDVVIGVGAACLSALGGYHLFQRYSPYEIRRKGDLPPPRRCARDSAGGPPSRP